MRARGRLVHPDTVFARARVAVFIDGCFWHRCLEHGNLPMSNTFYWGPKLARNVERDREVTSTLQRDGCLVLRYWKHRIRRSRRPRSRELSLGGRRLARAPWWPRSLRL